jgi:hypothetical protein
MGLGEQVGIAASVVEERFYEILNRGAKRGLRLRVTLLKLLTSLVRSLDPPEPSRPWS